jgi:hypothetical protein
MLARQRQRGERVGGFSRLRDRNDQLAFLDDGIAIAELRALPPEPERPADTNNAEAMAAYLLQKAEYDGVVQQIRADFRARQAALKNADTTFERGFTALVALSRAGTRATCNFENAWLWLIE